MSSVFEQPITKLLWSFYGAVPRNQARYVLSCIAPELSSQELSLFSQAEFRQSRPFTGDRS